MVDKKAEGENARSETDRTTAFEKWQKENYPKAYYKPRGLKIP